MANPVGSIMRDPRMDYGWEKNQSTKFSILLQLRQKAR
jgi:hypothetical protein